MAAQVRVVERGERSEVGPARVLADLRLQHPPRRERAGEAGDEDLADLELLGEEDRVHRAGPAERDEREVARLDPLLDGQRADRLRHLRVDDVAHALGQVRRRESELVAEVRERALRSIPVERHLPAREVGRVDAPEQQVRVRDRDPRAAAPVAGGAGVGAGALGPDAQAARLRVGQRAASGARRCGC